MTPFDTFCVVDWAGGKDTGPRPRKDAIWACVAGDAPVYLRSRAVALTWLTDLIGAELAAGRRLWLGFDFPFGLPAGCAQQITGSSDPLDLWAWFQRELDPAADGTDRFALAGRINRLFPGIGPFWFNGGRADIPDLPRKGTDRADHAQPERRAVEGVLPGAFPVWQMGGAGAVGGQAMTGMAALAALRASFPGQVAAWPFEALDPPVALVEVWPSLIAPQIAARQHTDEIKDAAQVRVLAEAVQRMQADGTLDQALEVPAAAADEGWIFGATQRAVVAGAALGLRRFADDCFALPPGVAWTPVDQALGHLRAALNVVPGAGEVPLERADGRILADPVIALRSNPPAPNAAVDGYGFAHSALTGPGPFSLSLAPGRAAAGAALQGGVAQGDAVRILTGAILPEGVDTVVLEEDCTLRDGRVAFAGPVKPGANTRRAGEDVVAGEVALPAGHVLRPQDLALLTALGLDRVTVRGQLRVVVLSTGDELTAPGQAKRPDQIADANGPMLMQLTDRWGHDPVFLGRVPDDRAALRQAFDTGAARADVIFTSGGASAGDEDHVSALLSETGSMQMWRIALKPGRPLGLGVWQGVPVFALPGNPVAAFVCALIFGRPALSLMSGQGWAEPQGFQVPAAFSKSKKPGRREYLRARMGPDGVEVFKSEGSGRISGLSWADGLVELPDGALEVTPGTPVTYYPFSSFGI